MPGHLGCRLAWQADASNLEIDVYRLVLGGLFCVLVLTSCTASRRSWKVDDYQRLTHRTFHDAAIFHVPLDFDDLDYGRLQPRSLWGGILLGSTGLSKVQTGPGLPVV